MSENIRSRDSKRTTSCQGPPFPFHREEGWFSRTECSDKILLLVFISDPHLSKGFVPIPELSDQDLFEAGVRLMVNQLPDLEFAFDEAVEVIDVDEGKHVENDLDR